MKQSNYIFTYAIALGMMVTVQPERTYASTEPVKTTYASVYAEVDEEQDDLKIYTRLRAFPEHSGALTLKLNSSFKVDSVAIAERPIPFQHQKNELTLKPNFPLMSNSKTVIALSYHKHFPLGYLKQNGLLLESQDNWLPLSATDELMTADIHVKVHPAWRLLTPNDQVKSVFQPKKQVYDLTVRPTTTLPFLIAGRYRIRSLSQTTLFEPHRFHLTLPEKLDLDKKDIYVVTPQLKSTKTIKYQTENWHLLPAPQDLTDLRVWLDLAPKALPSSPPKTERPSLLLEPSPYETSPVSSPSIEVIPPNLNRPEILVSTPTPIPSPNASSTPYKTVMEPVLQKKPPQFWTDSTLTSAIKKARDGHLEPGLFVDYLTLNNQQRFKQRWFSQAPLNGLFKYYFDSVSLVQQPNNSYLLSGKILSNTDVPLSLHIQAGEKQLNYSLETDAKNGISFELSLPLKPERMYLSPEDHFPSFTDAKPMILDLMHEKNITIVHPDNTHVYDGLITKIKVTYPTIKFELSPESAVVKQFPSKSLLLIGTPEEFTLLNEWADQIPYRIQSKYYWDQGKLWERSNIGMTAIFPHPAAPDRYSVAWMIPNPANPLDLSALEKESTAVLIKKDGVVSSKTTPSNFALAEYIFY
jgi:hypothetical protein